MKTIVDFTNEGFKKNTKKTETESSILVSSSKYLNHPLIRQQLPTMMLRKNSLSFRSEADHTLGVYNAFEGLRDLNRVEELFEAECKRNKKIAAWFEEGYLSTWTNADFKQYPKGSVGGIMYDYIERYGFDVTLGRTAESPLPKTKYEYYLVRGLQIHDLEHIVLGGSTDAIGELIPYFARFANNSKHLSAELATELASYMMFGALRFLTRATLHYPDAFGPALKCIELGIRAGEMSDWYIMAKYEDYLHLTPDEVREKLGIRIAGEFSTEAVSAIFNEEAPPSARAAD